MAHRLQFINTWNCSCRCSRTILKIHDTLLDCSFYHQCLPQRSIPPALYVNNPLSGFFLSLSLFSCRVVKPIADLWPRTNTTLNVWYVVIRATLRSSSTLSVAAGNFPITLCCEGTIRSDHGLNGDLRLISRCYFGFYSSLKGDEIISRLLIWSMSSDRYLYDTTNFKFCANRKTNIIVLSIWITNLPFYQYFKVNCPVYDVNPKNKPLRIH